MGQPLSVNIRDFTTAVEAVIRQLKRQLLITIDNLTSLDVLSEAVVKDRLLDGVAEDVRSFIYGRLQEQADNPRLNHIAAKTVAAALTASLRADAYRIMGASVRRRLRSARWANDVAEFRAALLEAFEKRLKEEVKDACRDAEDHLKTSGVASLLLRERERDQEGT